MPACVFVHSDSYEADIGAHVFPTWKYRRVKERLLESGLVDTGAFLEPEPRPRRLLEHVHEARYLDDLFSLRTTPSTLSSELPLTTEIAQWFELACAGSLTAVELALAGGGSMHIGGGFHHAFANRAEGFCYLNDIAYAARLAMGVDDGVPLANAQGRPVKSVSVVDLDVHQGNGTARIFADDSRVFTFSMHQENNYPVKERGDLDLGLEDGLTDEPYLEILEQGLEASVRARRPDLVIYVAGADPYREDLLGGLGLSLEGLRARDRAVLKACRDSDAAVVVVLAGGYAAERDDTSLIHFQTAEELLALWPWKSTE